MIMYDSDGHRRIHYGKLGPIIFYINIPMPKAWANLDIRFFGRTIYSTISCNGFRLRLSGDIVPDRCAADEECHCAENRKRLFGWLRG